MSFCDTTWDEVAPLRRAILDQPFLAELADGSLNPESFRHYIVQDSLYLAEYARVLAIAAARAPTAAARLEFSDGAKIAVQVEEALHQAFFAQFGVTPDIARGSEASPVCQGYTGYLTSLAATRSYEELIAGILPCFWVYWEVGCTIKPRAVSPNPYAALEIVFWLMGSLSDRSLDHVLLCLPLMAVGWALMLSTGSALDALTLGEDTAASLGVGLVSVRLRLVTGAALAVGSGVAVSGAIGFVGLVVPHLMRPLVGARPGACLLPSGLAGAVLVLAADLGVRLLATRPELKLGVVTALVGAPFLIVLLLRSRGRRA